MVNDLFGVPLKQVCKDFIEHFSICLHKRDWLIIFFFFFCGIFIWLGVRVMLDFVKEDLRQCFLSYFVE